MSTRSSPTSRTPLDVPATEGDQPLHTLAEAVALGEDLGPGQLRTALWEHASGVHLFLPPAPEEAVGLGAAELEPVIEASCGAVDAVVLHLPRGLDAITSACATRADRLLEILTLDVGSFRGASRVLEGLAPLHLEDRLELVVNKAERSEITVGDVDRVFGRPPIAVFPSERSVRAAHERGRLAPARSRMARRFDRLAVLIAPPAGEGPARAEEAVPSPS
jgi:Flp pilus assembly CpaE family ATPase